MSTHVPLPPPLLNGRDDVVCVSSSRLFVTVARSLQVVMTPFMSVRWIMLLGPRRVKVTLLTLLRTRLTAVRFDPGMARLIRAMLLATITPAPNFSWARNTPTRRLAAPRVLLRTMNVLPSAWLCTQVSGVILTALLLTHCPSRLVLSTLDSVLHSGCRHGLIPLPSAFGRKLRPLFVLMVGWASTTCWIRSLRKVCIVPVMVRQAPLAFVGLTVKATARDLTVPMQVTRLVAPVWIGPLSVKATMFGMRGCCSLVALL